MIIVDESIVCPHCNKQLLQTFRFEKNIPWSPNVHHCRRCKIRLFSWVVYSNSYGYGKRVLLPLNSFQFKSLVDEIDSGHHNYIKEKPLVLTESEFEEDGLDLIYSIYEHKERIRRQVFN